MWSGVIAHTFEVCPCDAISYVLLTPPNALLRWMGGVIYCSFMARFLS